MTKNIPVFSDCGLNLQNLQMLPETLKALGLPMLEIAKQDSAQIFSLCSKSYLMNSLSAVPFREEL